MTKRQCSRTVTTGNSCHLLPREPTESDEFVLCTIKADANGVISIRPDFNKGRKAYKIEAAGMGRGQAMGVTSFETF